MRRTMTFDANRDIKIEASVAPDGTYGLRTSGLAAQKRPELEVVGVPESLLHSAAAVLNDVADYTVNRAEVLAEQNIAFELAVKDNDESLLLAVRAEQAVAPSNGGFFGKLLGGGNKGVLRLVDVAARGSASALTAIASMQVHRSKVRLARGEEDAAREDLRAAVEAFPGGPDGDAREGAEIEADGGAYNWQNHLAWLMLAELDDSVTCFGDAVQRSRRLAREELGGTLEEIAATDAATARQVAERVLSENLARSEAPATANSVVFSPVWEVTADGSQAFRRASLVPVGFRELYFDGIAAERLREHGARLATDAFVAARGAPWTIAWRFRALRNVWLDRNAPRQPLAEVLPAAGLVSTILVAVGRAFRAGASADDVAGYLEGRPSPALEKALLGVDAWELEQYERALFGGSP